MPVFHIGEPKIMCHSASYSSFLLKCTWEAADYIAQVLVSLLHMWETWMGF